MLAVDVYLQSKLMYFPTPFLHVPHATASREKTFWVDILGIFFYILVQ